MATVDFKLSAEEGQAVQAFLKVLDAQKKVEKQTERVAQKGDDLGKVFDKAGKVMAGLGLSFGVVEGLQKVVELYGKMDNHLKSIAEKQLQLRPNLATFALAQTPGEAQQANYNISKRGAQYGMSPSQSRDMFQSIQGTLTIPEDKHLKVFDLLGKGRMAGMSPEALKTMITSASAGGMNADEALIGTYLAGQFSSESPELATDFSRALPLYEDKNFAMASIASLIQASDKGTYTTLGMAAATGLDKDYKLWKKLGVKGGSQIEKIEALKKAGLSTPKQLMDAGITEVSERRGISALVVGLDNIKKQAALAKEIATTNPEYLDKELAAREQAMPQLQAINRLDIAKAQTAFQEEFSPTALKSLNYGAQSEAYRQDMIDRGVDWFWDQGESFGPVERKLYELMNPSVARRERNMMSYRNMKYGIGGRKDMGQLAQLADEVLPDAPSIAGVDANTFARYRNPDLPEAMPQEQVDRLIKALDSVVESIEMNTKATAQNTGTTQASTGSGVNNE